MRHYSNNYLHYGVHPDHGADIREFLKEFLPLRNTNNLDE